MTTLGIKFLLGQKRNDNMASTHVNTLSVADKEQLYLNLTGKCSIALACFWGLLSVENSSVFSTGILHWIFEASLFTCLIGLIFFAVKSWAFKGQFNTKAFWTLQFVDEYTDYVSSLSIRLAFMVMSIGLMLLVVFGDAPWLYELAGESALLNFAHIVLSLSFLLHGVVVLVKLAGNDNDE